MAIIRDKKEFSLGLAMTVGFFIVLIVMFMPIFNGQNAFTAADNLFNSISKGSTNYFDSLRAMNTFNGKTIDVTLEYENANLAEQAQVMMQDAGMTASVSGQSISVQGDLGRLAGVILDDSRAMFDNNGQALSSKYGFEETQAMYTWWVSLDEMVSALNAQKEFNAAKYLGEVTKRGVEVGYNFYGIEPQSAASRAGILTFSLIFYTVYTMWWGFAIFFMFEGCGLAMSKGKKTEH